jgi:hypothetical protein
MPTWRPGGFAGGPFVEPRKPALADFELGCFLYRWGVAKW